MYEFLRPVSRGVLDFIDGLPSQSLGKKVSFESMQQLEDASNYQIALIGVLDNRGNCNSDFVVDLESIRKAIYSLYPGNWGLRLIDLGDILPGDAVEDTYFLVKSVVADLVKKQIVPIVIGGAQDLTYAMYRGLSSGENAINLVSIDSKLDLAKNTSNLAESFLSRIILEEPVNLYSFSNIGFQTYFNSQEEIDLIESMHFEAFRVGDISANIQRAEPVLRDADIVSLDLGAIKSSDSGNLKNFNPNGFDGREICALSRYTGLSDRVQTFGIFNYNNSRSEALLIAQIVWYFIEGVNFRTNEYPFQYNGNYVKYIVPIEEYDDFVFYKSNISGRWWVENPLVKLSDKQLDSVLPCSYEDYQQTIQGDIPERWWRIVKRSLV